MYGNALIQLNYYGKKYTEYLSEQNFVFAEYTSSIVRLFKLAGVKNKLIPFTQPSGYGFLAQGNTYLFDNMGNLQEYPVGLMIQSFAEAKGTLKRHILENFSPIFWINCLLFLPRSIMEYLGVKGDTLIVKLFQLLYWFSTPFLLAFREQIYQYILSLFG